MLLGFLWVSFFDAELTHRPHSSYIYIYIFFGGGSYFFESCKVIPKSNYCGAYGLAALRV